MFLIAFKNNFTYTCAHVLKCYSNYFFVFGPYTHVMIGDKVKLEPGMNAFKIFSVHTVTAIYTTNIKDFLLFKKWCSSIKHLH